MKGFLSQSEMLRAVNPKLFRRVATTPMVVKASPIALYKLNSTISSYHSSARAENELIVAGLTIGAVTVTLQYAMKGFAAYAQKRAAKQAAAPESESSTTTTNTASGAGEEVSEATTKASEDALNEAKKQADAQHKKRATDAKSSFFGSLLNSSWFAKNFYDGGFEDKMTKREAALILGIRESATPERIKDAHRRIMQINHPDKGGSAYVTAKVNEAKDMLIKGKN